MKNTSTQEKERNFNLLISEVEKFWQENRMSRHLKCLPTQKHLSEKTGLSIRTVKRHYLNIKKAFHIFDDNYKY